MIGLNSDGLVRTIEQLRAEIKDINIEVPSGTSFDFLHSIHQEVYGKATETKKISDSIKYPLKPTSKCKI